MACFVLTNSVVLNLGCGLDTRVDRINHSPYVLWYDIDFSEVIELRKKFFSENKTYHMIASSITDPQWITTVPSDRDVVVIADGVFEYLTQPNVQELLNHITDHFTHGIVMFDVMNSFAINSGKKELEHQMNAKHTWAVDHIATVNQLNTKLHLRSNLSFWRSSFIRSLPIKSWFLYRCMLFLP